MRRAALDDGTPFSVKVIHAGADAKVGEGVDLMQAIAENQEEDDPELARLRPTVMVEEFSDMMDAAIDLRQALSNLQRFQANFANSDDVIIHARDGRCFPFGGQKRPLGPFEPDLARLTGGSPGQSGEVAPPISLAPQGGTALGAEAQTGMFDQSSQAVHRADRTDRDDGNGRAAERASPGARAVVQSYDIS